MSKKRIEITPEIQQMMDNFRENFPHLELPPLSWFALSDEECVNAENAPVSWRYGVYTKEKQREMLGPYYED